MVYLVLFLALVLNAIANISIKIGMTKIGDFNSLPDMLLKAISNPYIILGGICFLLNLIAYAFALSRLNLSIAYPIMVSVGLLIIVFVSWLLLKEAITVPQVIGFVLIISGVWLVAR